MLSDVIIALLVNSSANIMYALIKSISKSKCSECSFGCCTIKRDVAKKKKMNLKYYIRDNLLIITLIIKVKHKYLIHYNIIHDLRIFRCNNANGLKPQTKRRDNRAKKRN